MTTATAAVDLDTKLQIRFASLRLWLAENPDKAEHLKQLHVYFDAWDEYLQKDLADRDPTALSSFEANLNGAEEDAAAQGYVAPGPRIGGIDVVDAVPLGREAQDLLDAANKLRQQLTPTFPWYAKLGIALGVLGVGYVGVKAATVAINTNPAVALARGLMNNRDEKEKRR